MPADGEETKVGSSDRIAAARRWSSSMAIAGWAIAIATEACTASWTGPLLLPVARPGLGMRSSKVRIFDITGKVIAYRVTVKRGAQTIERWRYSASSRTRIGRRN